MFKEREPEEISQHIENSAKTHSPTENTPETAPLFSEEEVGALLVAAVESPETRETLRRQFAEAPRTREAARLLREIYGDAEVSLPRTDGQPRYIWFFHDGSGFYSLKG